MNAQIVYVQIAFGMAFPQKIKQDRKGDILFLDNLEKIISECVQVAYDTSYVSVRYKL